MRTVFNCVFNIIEPIERSVEANYIYSFLPRNDTNLQFYLHGKFYIHGEAKEGSNKTNTKIWVSIDTHVEAYILEEQYQLRGAVSKKR